MDYHSEQEMEIEALRAILMDDFQELEDTDGLDASGGPYYQILIYPEEDEEESSTHSSQVSLIFAHTPKYPDEAPIVDVRSVKGVRDSEAKELKEKLQAEALENLGMAMIYTLVTSAKEWLSEKFKSSEAGSVVDEEEASPLDEVVEPHGELVNLDTFIAWRERFEAELALEKARLMPDSALNTSKEKRLSGRAWFESGLKAGKPVTETVDEEGEEDIDFDVDYDDGDLDEDDMLEHYLSQKTEK